MHRRFRSLAARAAWAVTGVLSAAGAAQAQSPKTAGDRWQNPIAASNSLTVAPPVPVGPLAGAPELEPPSAALGAPNPGPLPPPVPLAPQPAPVPAAPPAMLRGTVTGPATVTSYAPPSAGRAVVSSPLPPPPSPLSANWSPPARRPAPDASTLPVPERPLVPCEETPVAAAKASTPSPAPETLTVPPSAAPAEAGRAAGPKPAPAPPPPAPEAAKPPAKPRPLSSCRFTDSKPSAPAKADENVIFAAVRGAWGAPAGAGGAEALKRAVEDVCRAASARDVLVEVVGERQVRAALTVYSPTEWQLLYARMQSLPELGDQGIVFRVRVPSASDGASEKQPDASRNASAKRR
jgi:hypothetical protein